MGGWNRSGMAIKQTNIMVVLQLLQHVDVESDFHCTLHVKSRFSRESPSVFRRVRPDRCDPFYLMLTNEQNCSSGFQPIDGNETRTNARGATSLHGCYIVYLGNRSLLLSGGHN